MLSKTRFKEWFDRYKYAELAATTAAILSSQFSRVFSSLTTAYLITFTEYIAFYGVIIVTAYLQLSKRNKAAGKATSKNDILQIVKNLLLEFGYPAILDLLFVRPFCMFWLPILTGNAITGVIAGKICADVVFYFLTIVNYEWMKSKNHF
ncbi:hypothetical protein [Flavobacterium muglaense]|uniref:Uncharacterized protein n=1 Tax=Flavobacterium muglaense TaxID=2764716 RepID=A0A923SFS6_9FLAO|nr:hypothetical protein [Flavobacterium muglaense]MBC5838245.1 hypothetical protein [Flavobacterium muglaense]MBC5844780.1 hypothetical protein [Flavobacterium muglaense]